MSRNLKIFISAGESSGDVYGAALARSLRAARGDVSIYGIGLSKMKQAGVSLFVNFSGHSVMGVTEILSSVYENYRTIKKAGAFFKSEGIDALVLIDYAGFNLELARQAKRHGIKVFYFIPPKLWAWGSFRMKKLKSFVDRIYAIFPFELDYFSDHGIETRFYGHPLFDIIRNSGFDYAGFMNEETGGSRQRENVVVLMPGSRRSEIMNNLPIMLECAAGLHEKYCGAYPGLRFAMPVAPSADTGLVEKLLKGSRVGVEMVGGELEKYELFSKALFAVATSGTATLELAVFGVPMIITYRVALFTEIAGRLLINSRFIGLPNIIHGSEVVPELLQRSANPENIIYHASKILGTAGSLAARRKLLLKTAELLKFDGGASPVGLAAKDICVQLPGG